MALLRAIGQAKALRLLPYEASVTLTPPKRILTPKRIRQIRDAATVQKVEGMLIQEWELVALCDSAKALQELTLAVGDHPDAMMATGDLHTPFMRACKALEMMGGNSEQ